MFVIDLQEGIFSRHAAYSRIRSVYSTFNVGRIASYTTYTLITLAPTIAAEFSAGCFARGGFLLSVLCQLIFHNQVRQAK
jgi:hypothetical protein